MKRILIVFIGLVLTFHLEAQNAAISKADNLYRLYAYSEAVDYYQKLLLRSPENEYLIQQIAYCYNKMGQYKQALIYYEKHVKSSRARSEDHYQYALLLLIDGQFEKAKEEFKTYQLLNPTDKRPGEQIERIENFGKLNLLHLVDTIFCESFNTRFSDMSAAFYKDKIAFVSARDSSGGITYSWNNQPFLDIYQLDTIINGKPEVKKMIGVNSKYHEGPMVFTNNFNTIWFTRNSPEFSGANNEQTSNLKIFTSEWDGKKWKNEKEFQYNSDNYSVGHPAFSPDGNTMYFASNMKGSVGETDLFKVKKVQKENKKGELVWSWSEPENMGPQFNTTGKEMFPFVDSRGVLFFASDGFVGFGGLDIFAAFPVADSFNVMNLGQPINSPYDDFSFIINNDFSAGYLTSNRSGGMGSDDIYSFKIGFQKLFLHIKSLKSGQPIVNSSVKYTVDGVSKILDNSDKEGVVSLNINIYKTYYFEVSSPDFIAITDSLQPNELFKIPNHSKTILLDNVIKKTTQLQLIAVNEENGDPITGVSVKIIEDNGKSTDFSTDGVGKVIYNIEKAGKLNISFSKDGFATKETTLMIDKSGTGNISNTTKLIPIYKGKTFVLENLYYDVNKSVIRPDAALVLDQLYKILVDMPKIKIELSSHTDCRASTEYNLTLSQKRAESAVNYLVSKGIAKNRMVAKGYGESKLLNKCADGVPCTEEEHQKNRRTEIKILGI
jgi:outer membrane protein OmpA-like peptidoglycan-associated protein/tetratricopeptide (TPR) repeat protein